MVEIFCVLRKMTSAAILIDDDDGNLTWIPISQINNWDENEAIVDEVLEIEIPEWLANAKDLI